jgi:hypothetical protein
MLFRISDLGLSDDELARCVSRGRVTRDLLPQSWSADAEKRIGVDARSNRAMNGGGQCTNNRVL